MAVIRVSARVFLSNGLAVRISEQPTARNDLNICKPTGSTLTLQDRRWFVAVREKEFSPLRDGITRTTITRDILSHRVHKPYLATGRNLTLKFRVSLNSLNLPMIINQLMISVHSLQ